ncbi:DUF6317 family protein [Rhodococcus sp. NPDC058521]|uniref:DUF6317 family protein n=1 Tax=Rhodococcus sp. NPDC058521 TaxID=3346536 RepID=UPI00364A0284
MGDLKVVLGDLSSMASTFDEQAKSYRDITPRVTPPIAASGDGALDGIIKGAMDLIAILHEQMATAIEGHAEKLHTAHDAYERQDIDNRFLYDNLMKDES